MRKVRYRQILKSRIGDTGHIYRYQVRLQQSFWNEDQAFAWTIPQVREIHSSLGTWDKLTTWNRTPMRGNFIRVKKTNGVINTYVPIFPKENYKSIKKTCAKFKAYIEKKSQEARWKEQVQRTLDFLEREGC